MVRQNFILAIFIPPVANADALAFRCVCQNHKINHRTKAGLVTRGKSSLPVSDFQVRNFVLFVRGTFFPSLIMIMTFVISTKPSVGEICFYYDISFCKSGFFSNKGLLINSEGKYCGALHLWFQFILFFNKDYGHACPVFSGLWLIFQV